MSGEQNDIHLEWNEDKGFFDLELLLDGSDLLAAVDLRTSISISLFTDRRTNDDDTIPNEAGWPGDAIRDVGEDLLGSKLWLLQNQRAVDPLLPVARQYVEESLQWLLDDNVAREVNVSTSYRSKPMGIMLIDIEVVRFSGKSERFEYVWNQRLLADGNKVSN